MFKQSANFAFEASQFSITYFATIRFDTKAAEIELPAWRELFLKSILLPSIWSSSRIS